MKETPGNVLFIFADQMQAFAMGCMGNADLDTPNLDRLAAQGTLFENCYSCNPLCTPYRASLFSGRYSSQIGILNNTHAPIPEGERTIADGLNAGGVHTSYVGKWHIGGSGNEWVPPELRAGFTDFIGYQCYNDFLYDIWFFDEQGKRRDCQTHRLTATTDIAIERMEKIKDRQFALFVSYQCPHDPVQPSPEFVELYRDRELHLRPSFAELDRPLRTQDSAWKDWDRWPAYLTEPDTTLTYARLYYALITQMDEQIGRLLEKLEQWGIADNTLVVFTADHGELLGSHGLKNKHIYYEESTHVPLIVRDPSVAKQGQTVANHISTVDFLPTILDWCGCAPSPMAEGYNFLPLAHGEDWAKTENSVFTENMGGGLYPPYLMQVKDNLKFAIERNTHEPLALYDLTADPFELDNRIENPEMQPLIADWTEKLKAFHADILSRANPNRQ